MSIVVSGCGLVSSLGWDVVTAGASLRSGLKRPREILEFEHLISGYPVYSLTEEFIAAGRWGCLLERCFEDLVLGGNLPDAGEDAFWGRTGVYKLSIELV